MSLLCKNIRNLSPRKKTYYTVCQIKLTPISQCFDFKTDFMACLPDTEKNEGVIDRWRAGLLYEQVKCAFPL